MVQAKAREHTQSALERRLGMAALMRTTMKSGSWGVLAQWRAVRMHCEPETPPNSEIRCR